MEECSVAYAAGISPVSACESALQPRGSYVIVLFSNRKSVDIGVDRIWSGVGGDACVGTKLVFLLSGDYDIGQVYLSVWKNYSGNVTDSVYGSSVCAEI